MVFRGRGFRVDNVRVKGLTRYLKQRFWPRHTELSSAPSHPVQPQMTCDVATDGCGVPNPLRTRLPPGARMRVRATRGRGQRVDTCVGRGVKLLRANGLSERRFGVAAPVAPVWLPEIADTAERRKIRAWLANPCLHGRLVFTLLHKLSLRAWETQTAVANPSLALATACDLVCKDERGDAVVVELKACSERLMHCASGFMAPPFEDVPDSPLNQALVQLAATRSFFRRTHPRRPLSARAYVFYISDTHASAYRLPARLRRTHAFD